MNLVFALAHICVSTIGIALNFALAFLLARRPPGLIGRYRPIQGTIVTMDSLRCVLNPLLAYKSWFLSHRSTRFSLASLAQSLVVATVASESSRLNGLLSVKWIIIIVLLTVVQCATLPLCVRFFEATQRSISSRLLVIYSIHAASYLNETFEAIKFVMMLSIGYRTHRFILCAIFTKQASRMHRMGLKVISYQALTHLLFSFLPLIVLPRVTARFNEISLIFNGLQAIIDPIIVLWLTPEYRKMMRRRNSKKRRPIAYVASTVPNYTQSALEASDSLRNAALPKFTEASLFSRYCSKV